MEKKTFGSFLSTLRKAKGMTQKDLAELLNVSDKAVSRWERDESMSAIAAVWKYWWCCRHCGVCGY